MYEEGCYIYIKNDDLSLWVFFDIDEMPQNEEYTPLSEYLMRVDHISQIPEHLETELRNIIEHYDDCAQKEAGIIVELICCLANIKKIN